ncbi:MAG: hypothetical protein NVSMB8_04700 [Candidatus Limnocylindrales bacterium]
MLVLLYRPLPTTDADMRLLGLDQRAEIIRDAWGVPHIFARTTHDLFYLQGYAVAQDRLFQLELLRRAGRGELAALIGPGGAPSDALVAASGPAVTERDRTGLGSSARSVAQAYADGINKFLEQHGESLPLEFTLLGMRPAPWILDDTLAVQHLLSLPRGPLSPITEGIAGGGSDAGASCRATAVRTGQGHPILEGDPRLAGEVNPSLWYTVTLSGPKDEVAGLAAPGVPGIAIGRNRRAAWSFIAGPGASLLGDLDAALALWRAEDPAAFGAAIAGAKGPTPAYCYADVAGHIGTAGVTGASFDPPSGEVRQERPRAVGARSTAATFRHPLDALLPAAIGSLLAIGPHRRPADGALERLRIDLGDPDGIRLGLPTGESGQAAARHHGDQAARWRSGDPPELALSRSRLGAGEGALVLRAR